MVIPRSLLLGSGIVATVTALTAVPVGAQLRQSVTVDAGVGAVLPLESEATIASFATAELDLRSALDPQVSGRVQLRATALDTATDEQNVLIALPRAFARARLPFGRRKLTLTAGRTRLTWGDGQVFNAGDTINGARAATLDLGGRTPRDETVWLGAARVPLGRFAFAEAVALPGLSPRAWWAQTAGGRVQAQVLGVKTELSYLYRGQNATTDLAAGLQGNLFVDVYTSVNASVADGRVDWVGSAGLLHNGRVGSGGWSFRLEGLADWRDTAVLIYPEITWSPSPLFHVFGRSEIVLTGPTSRSSAGVRWSPATGMTLSLVTQYAGAGLDGTPAAGRFSVATSLRYVF